MEFISLVEQDFFVHIFTRESSCITREIASKLKVKPFEYSLYFSLMNTEAY